MSVYKRLKNTVEDPTIDKSSENETKNEQDDHDDDPPPVLIHAHTGCLFKKTNHTRPYVKQKKTVMEHKNWPNYWCLKVES